MTTRKRRRTPPSDWQLPVLTGWGFTPKQQRLLVVIGSIAGVLLLALGMVAIVASINSSGSTSRPVSAAAPGFGQAMPEEFHGWQSPKGLEPIADRAKDAKPFTEKELFAQKNLVIDKKRSLKLAGGAVAAECASSFWGQALVDALGAAGCTQVARGVYQSSDRRYVAQYTLLNLRDAKAAGELVTALGTLHRGGWVLPLEQAGGAFVSGGYSQGGAYALGHYVGLVWIAKADGSEPTAKDDLTALALTVRGAEKPIYRRVVAITGPGA
ncbi:hypothetical protein ACIBG8_16420 [Nonomuraea sp. NPDC050556]|uniref:hypothetical protein n=1 Tax=Nonomuraea sp. NPDC050556 TaxID=3364369 RepID=UPI0037A5CCC1